MRPPPAASIHPSFDRRIAIHATRQHGVFSRAQALRVGATRGLIDHRVEVGRWDRVSRDVFRLAGAPASWRQELMAARLIWGAGSAISHRSAAALGRLAGFDPGPVDLTIPRTRQRIGPGLIYRNRLYAADVTIVDGIPTTTVARTLIDLASVCPCDAVEEVLDDAIRRKLVSIRRMRWRLDEIGGRGGRPGVGVIRSLLDTREHGAVPQSVFETRLLRAIKAAGIPAPIGQYELRDPSGRTAIVDFAFPAERVAIEADGYRWHSGRARWQSDLARRNMITSLGWRVIHVTWDDLRHRPNVVIDSVKRTLVTERHEA